MTASHTPLTIKAPVAQRSQLKAFAEKLKAVMESERTQATLTTPSGEKVVLPPTLLPLLAYAAEVLAGGEALTIVPAAEEVTTQRAAEMLNISRQYLVRLLESGEIPYRKTGAHRRVHIQDVLTYRKKRG